MNAMPPALDAQKHAQLIYLLEDDELAPLLWRIAALGHEERALVASMVALLNQPVRSAGR